MEADVETSVMKRLSTMCHLWPSISPHGPQVPTSVWNLQYGVWLGLAKAADKHEKEVSK